MAQIDEQVHENFKVFFGEVGTDGSIGSISDEVTQFVEENKVAAKSIGVEYIESIKKLMVTLGYRTGEESYPVRLTSVSLGKIDDLTSADSHAQIENAVSNASKGVSNIICHEIFVTEANDFSMVFMTHQA